MNPNSSHFSDLLEKFSIKIPWVDQFERNSNNPDVLKSLLSMFLKQTIKMSNHIKFAIWSNPAIFQKEDKVLSELIKDETYYVVYNTETNKEEKTFNSLKDAQEYAIF
jgi:hypothetical protein